MCFDSGAVVGSVSDDAAADAADAGAAADDDDEDDEDDDDEDDEEEGALLLLDEEAAAAVGAALPSRARLEPTSAMALSPRAPNAGGAWICGLVSHLSSPSPRPPAQRLLGQYRS